MRRFLAVAVACLAWAAPAQAADVTLSSPGVGRVVVARAPLRISFTDASGRRVLREMAPSAGGVGVVPPVPENQFGTQTSPPPALYAPFPFLVGTHKVNQTPSLQWQGTLQNVTEAGTLYAATKLLSAARSGPGLHLTLATSDPTGRTLDVTIAPRGRGFQVRARPVPAAGVAAMGDAFASSSREAFHGFGGRHDSIDARGTEFFNYLQQENLSSGSANRLTATSSPGGDRYMFPNGPYATYYAQSQFVSNAGYGFLAGPRRDRALADGRPTARTRGRPRWRAPRSTTWWRQAASRGRSAASQRSPAASQSPPAWALGGSILDRLVKYPSDDATQLPGRDARPTSRT